MTTLTVAQNKAITKLQILRSKAHFEVEDSAKPAQTEVIANHEVTIGYRRVMRETYYCAATPVMYCKLDGKRIKWDTLVEVLCAAAEQVPS